MNFKMKNEVKLNLVIALVRIPQYVIMPPTTDYFAELGAETANSQLLHSTYMFMRVSDFGIGTSNTLFTSWCIDTMCPTCLFVIILYLICCVRVHCSDVCQTIVSHTHILHTWNLPLCLEGMS